MKRRGLLLRHLHVPLSIAVAVAAVGIVAASLLRQSSTRQTFDSLAESARLAQASLLASPPGTEDAVCKRIGSPTLRVTVIRLDGRVLGDSEARVEDMENHLDREEFLAARQGRVGTSVRPSATVGRDMAYLALPVVTRGGTSLVVRVATPEAPILFDLRDLYGRIALAGVLALAALTVVTVLVERRRRRPILALQDAAAAFARGELDRRLSLRRPADLAAVAESLDAMAASLRARVQELSAQTAELAGVLSGMVEAVIILDDKLLVRGINPSALRLAGRGIAEVQGTSLLEVLRSTRLHDLALRALSSTTPLEDTVTFVGTPPTVVQVHAVPLADQAARLVLVLNDITRLDALEKVRRDFVAAVSHELNTPVTAVKGALATLLAGAIEDDPAAARRFAEAAQRHTDRLVALIEDLMALARLEKLDSGQLERHRCALEGIARAAAAICEARATARQVALVVSCDPGVSAEANPSLLEKALVNLVDNAIEYSNPGTRVSIEVRADADAVTLAVRDQGIGIPAQDLPRVFERFYRVDKGRARDAGGTGLGLAIVKHIVSAHGGSIRAESQPGAGSTFTIFLPARPLSEN
jgi:two-component system phosphate regulon sensor histidine kinase PhoR